MAVSKERHCGGKDDVARPYGGGNAGTGRGGCPTVLRTAWSVTGGGFLPQLMTWRAVRGYRPRRDERTATHAASRAPASGSTQERFAVLSQ